MSSSAISNIIPPIDAPPTHPLRDDDPDEGKSYGQLVFRDTFKNSRARTGIVWIATLAFMATFAPFLANSHPLLMKMGGHWSSPLLVHLTQTDVTLLVTFFAACVLSISSGMTWPQRLAILLWVVGLTLLLAWWPTIIKPMGGARRALLILALLLDLAVVVWVPWTLSVSMRLKGVMIGAMLA